MTLTEPIKIKKVSINAVTPIRHSEGAAGYDVSSLEGGIIPPKQLLKVRTGLIFSIPQNCLGVIFGRSGLALKHGLEIIDTKIFPNSKEELVITIFNNFNAEFKFDAGTRIAQLVIIKVSNPKIEIVDSLDDSKRGESGFGSTGLN